MSLTQIVQLLEALAATAGEIAPLFAQGKAVLGDTDAAQIHAALTTAEAATAALRRQVDAALGKAAAAT
jgi:ABC-type transporter Mla subunit MlaD